MPVEFLHETGDNSKDYKLLMAYDGSGRRISKTRYSKNVQYGYWTRDVVTHYTGIGTEVREAMRRSASPKTTVVVNLPQGLGRYMPEDAEKTALSTATLDENGRPTSWSVFNPKFEWYLKNHLGSTMLVYGTGDGAGSVKAAYDYRAFGEQVSLAEPTDKVTENFTGKEKDDETELNYFGARYLDPMLGMWTSVDPKRQFASPYLYAGNGVNPIGAIDPDGNETYLAVDENNQITGMSYTANENNIVTIAFADETYMLANEPPMESYFYSMTDGAYNIIGQTFDMEMSYKVDKMIERVSPINIWGWGTGGEYDFKSSYGKGNNLTVGVLNGTVMTARDAGNAVWAGYTRWMYGPLTRMYSDVQTISDLYAGYQKYGKSLKALTVSEDPSSAVMQKWGFENYEPK